MIDKIRENALVCFTLTVVASYFASVGYFQFFHIDITTFISIEDLTLIFVKWVWFTCFFVFMIISTIYSFFKRPENENSWWSKRLGRTMFKRRAIIVVPIITLVVLSYIYKSIADFLSGIFGLGIGLFILVGMILFLLSIFDKKSKISELGLKDWANLLAGTFTFLIAIPLFSGMAAAVNLSKENIKVKFENESMLQTSDSLNIVYIGKTTNYFFIYNKKTKSTTAFNMDLVKSFEIIPEKKK
jgi:hypothetical protein